MADQTLTPEEIDFLNSVFDLARDNKPIALKSLIDQGVPVDLTDSKGDTLLILATYHENREVVEMLLEAGANINALNNRGQTPLLCAVFRNNAELTQLLLQAGADTTLGHQSPLEVARFFQLPEMEKLLTA
ncbi:ankyrin repeat domain-containing protein [Rothia aerolata]|uniref:Ankyrin repeat domain-containing protein n=1 Tax=Rothia aerolata TaxID=1812262 RepID=A0A917MU35_9MICC|nr:ankyrin repeat domain-containing protein [Rothia aerolata]GGH63879.1 hypothetical protein GCM10007359_15620 [Rothia aerolata]